MRIYHDWEFLENGETIQPIAVAMCTDDGRELYRVFREIELEPLYSEIIGHEWLRANVLPHLPWRAVPGGVPVLDVLSPSVAAREQIRTDVRAFLGGYPAGIELWGWYSSYDHVCLAQLFGKMIDLPEGVPMWTNDLRQRLDEFRLSESALPGIEGKNHDPLAEVRLMRDWAAFMDNLERQGERYGLL
jgi:hypothetical protein